MRRDLVSVLAERVLVADGAIGAMALGHPTYRAPREGMPIEAIRELERRHPDGRE